jgi:hypothetical protein
MQSEAWEQFLDKGPIIIKYINKFWPKFMKLIVHSQLKDLERGWHDIGGIL